MDVDKTEGGRRRLEHRVKCSPSHPLVRGDHALHQEFQILRASADELWKWVAIMISLAQEYAVSAQTRLREASVFDQDCMQADHLIKRQGILAGL